ncbi:acetylornithine/succinyldiaminopimelate/putrescine aminotransferase [Paraburkholderia sp. GAS334]
MPVYMRSSLSFERGSGSTLYATDGTAYLDFGSGVAVNALGHGHPRVLDALINQAFKLWHTSNLYTSPQQERLAQQLCELTFAERVFFCNSGTEAVELAIKAARRYHYARGDHERNRIITVEGAFHGRTLGALMATGQAKYLEGFGPLPGGFDQVPFGDLAALEQAITERTAAVLVEPVQGESGVRPMPPGYGRCATATEFCCCSTRCKQASAARVASSPTSTKRLNRMCWPLRRDSGPGSRSGRRSRRRKSVQS